MKKGDWKGKDQFEISLPSLGKGNMRSNKYPVTQKSKGSWIELAGSSMPCSLIATIVRFVKHLALSSMENSWRNLQLLQMIREMSVISTIIWTMLQASFTVWCFVMSNESMRTLFVATLQYGLAMYWVRRLVYPHQCQFERNVGEHSLGRTLFYNWIIISHSRPSNNSEKCVLMLTWSEWHRTSPSIVCQSYLTCQNRCCFSGYPVHLKIMQNFRRQIFFWQYEDEKRPTGKPSQSESLSFSSYCPDSSLIVLLFNDVEPAAIEAYCFISFTLSAELFRCFRIEMISVFFTPLDWWPFPIKLRLPCSQSSRETCTNALHEVQIVMWPVFNIKNTPTWGRLLQAIHVFSNGSSPELWRCASVSWISSM